MSIRCSGPAGGWSLGWGKAALTLHSSGSTGSSYPALATSGAGTERGSALPGHPCPPWASLPCCSCSSWHWGGGIGHSKRDLGDAPEGRGAGAPSRLHHPGSGLGCGVMLARGAKAARSGCPPSCPVLKGSQQEGRELDKLAPELCQLQSSWELWKKHFGLVPARKPRAPSGQVLQLLPSCLPRAGGFLRVTDTELWGCFSPPAAGESSGSSLHKAARSRHVGQSAPRHRCSLCT